MCFWACRERNNQPLTGVAKLIDGWDKRVTTAAGKCWRQGMAAGDKSVDNRTMMKAADYRSCAGSSNEDNNNEDDQCKVGESVTATAM